MKGDKMECPHCKEEISSGATRCPYCGGGIEYGSPYGFLTYLYFCVGLCAAIGFIFFGSSFSERISAGTNGAIVGLVFTPILWIYSKFIAPRKG
jgi:hypothetical protein